MADSDKTYTQSEYDAMIAERDSLRANRDEILKEKKRADAALKNYEGFDPAEFKALKDAAAEAERKKAASEGDFKALEKQLVDRHAVELGTRDKRITTLQSALEQRLVDAEAARELAEAKGSVKVLLPHVKARTKVVETDGVFSVVVVDEAGNPRIADGKGTPMTLKGLVAEMRDDAEFARAFEGSGSSGGGASKSSAGGGGTKSLSAALMTPQDFMSNLDGIGKGEVTVTT